MATPPALLQTRGLTTEFKGFVAVNDVTFTIDLTAPRFLTFSPASGSKLTQVPAALTGTVGLKPTYGRVSRAGVVTLSWTLDHTGPMARSAEDCAFMLQALAGQALAAGKHVVVDKIMCLNAAEAETMIDAGIADLPAGLAVAPCVEGQRRIGEQHDRRGDRRRRPSRDRPSPASSASMKS